MQVKVPQAPQHLEKLRGLSHLLTEFACPGVGMEHLRSRLAPRVNQHWAQGGL